MTEQLALDLALPAQPQQPKGQTYARCPEQQHARDGHQFGGGWCVHVMCLGSFKSALESDVRHSTTGLGFALPAEW